MTNWTLTLAAKAVKTLCVFITFDRSEYHEFRNIFENSKRTRSVWTLTTLLLLCGLSLSGTLFAQTPVEQYRQNLQRQKQMSQAQYQQQYQQVPAQYQQQQYQQQQQQYQQQQYQQGSAQNRQAPAQYQQQQQYQQQKYQQGSAQNRQVPAQQQQQKYQQTQNRSSVMQSNAMTSERNRSDQRQARAVATSANSQQPVHYRTVPQQTVRSSSNNFQQKMMRQSPGARSARSPQFADSQPYGTQNRSSRNIASTPMVNSRSNSRGGYPNGYSNNYANGYMNNSVRPQRSTVELPSRLSRMKFSLSNSTQSALTAEQVSASTLQNGQNTKTSSAGPSAGSVWTAFLTGKYSPELVEWYVNQYQEKNANLNVSQDFDLYNAGQNANIQSGRELTATGTGYPQYRENQIAGYVARNPNRYAQRDLSPYQQAYAPSEAVRQQATSSAIPYPMENPYSGKAYSDPRAAVPNNSIGNIPLNANSQFDSNAPLNNNNALNNAYLWQRTPMASLLQAYPGEINQPLNERALGSNYPAVNSIPLAERSRYQSSLSALFKKKEKSPSASSQQLLAMQRQELQRQQWESQRRQWELRQLEDRRAIDYQRQLAVNSSRGQDPRSYSNAESYRNSQYYDDGPLSDEYNNHNNSPSSQAAVVVSNRKKDFAQRWAEISVRQEELAREQQWLAEQQSLLAQENSNLAPNTSGELPPPRPLVDQQVAYSQDYRNDGQAVAKVPSENYNNSYEEVNAPIQQVSGSVPYYQMPQMQNRSNLPRYESIQQNSSTRQPAVTQPKKNSGTNVYYPKGDFIP